MVANAQQMSFQGFGGFGSSGSGAGSGRGQRARKLFNLPSTCSRKTADPDKGQSPVDRHGEALEEAICDLVGNSEDTEVQEALHQSYHALQDEQRPSTGVIVNQTVQLVDLSASNISSREAILRMAGARFDYHAAVVKYLDEPEVDDSSSSLISPNGDERDEDPERVGGQVERDRCVFYDTEKESESSSEVCIIIVSF